MFSMLLFLFFKDMVLEMPNNLKKYNESIEYILKKLSATEQIYLITKKHLNKISITQHNASSTFKDFALSELDILLEDDTQLWKDIKIFKKILTIMNSFVLKKMSPHTYFAHQDEIKSLLTPLIKKTSRIRPKRSAGSGFGSLYEFNASVEALKGIANAMCQDLDTVTAQHVKLCSAVCKKETLSVVASDQKKYLVI